MDETIRQLEAFVAVARTLHFGGAADELGLSQPTVSQEVRRLERTWGVSLFDRTSRRVALTPAGKEMLPASQAVLDQLRAATELAVACRPERQGVARIVVSPSVANLLLPAVLGDVERELPDLQVIEDLTESGRVGARMAELAADFGIGRFLNERPGLAWEKLCDEPLCVVLSSRHPAAKAESVDLADLRELPLLLWPREQAPSYHDRLVEVCRERGLDPLLLVSPTQIVGPRLYLLRDLRAFTLVPQSTRVVLPPEVVARPLSVPASVPLEILHRQGDSRSWVEVFLRVVRGRARELAAST